MPGRCIGTTQSGNRAQIGKIIVGRGTQPGLGGEQRGVLQDRRKGHGLVHEMIDCSQLDPFIKPRVFECRADRRCYYTIPQ